MKTIHALSTQQIAGMAICKNCQRELPLESFYFNKTTLCPDKFCKECRKSISRKQYSSGKITKASLPEEHDYPVITEIGDRETRMQLIQHALEEVRLSMERKKKRVHEEEALLS